MFCCIQLPPPPTNRPRIITLRGRAALKTPQGVTEWKARAFGYVMRARPPVPYHAAVLVDIVVIIDRPKRLLTQKTPDGLLYATTTPDVDNTAKVVLDLFTRCEVWTDDSLVAGLSVHKFSAERGQRARIEVHVREAVGGESQFGTIYTVEQPIEVAVQTLTQRKKAAELMARGGEA